jgi:glycosyltransferase involved in cell wall biosynthesis
VLITYPDVVCEKIISMMKPDPSATIIIPCGPGKESVLDTADSIDHYCPEPHNVVFVDDYTTDGTYEALQAAKRPNWHIIRDKKRNGFLNLHKMLCAGYRYAYNNFPGCLVLKLDSDALMIRSGIITDALEYMKTNPDIGLFGVYKIDYNKPRDFTMHKRQMDRASSPWRQIIGLRPLWTKLLRVAESKGYKRGENVFGGGYFITWPCLDAMNKSGYLDPPDSWYGPVTEFCLKTFQNILRRNLPYSWHSRLAEDVYFSMAAVAAGYKLGHFAVPTAPICLEWRGLPYPAKEMWSQGYKLVHSVDKGPNTSANENEGLTARELFRKIRESEINCEQSRPNQYQVPGKLD